MSSGDKSNRNRKRDVFTNIVTLLTSKSNFKMYDIVRTTNHQDGIWSVMESDDKVP